MTKALIPILIFFGLVFSLNPASGNSSTEPKTVNKISLGNMLALYPSIATVIGAEVDGKVNWLLVTHTGIIGHNRIMVSLSKKHYTNKGIRASKKLSINLIGRDMLQKADYVGSVSGADTDKSNVFDYHLGKNGSPVIDASPLSMELKVVDIYETEDFDNFICSIANTYADANVVTNGKPDYDKLKPVLFEFPTYSYLATGEIIGKCRRLDKLPGMAPKLPMQPDGIIRLSQIEVDPAYLDEYVKFATEVGEISLRTEPGVLTMYAVVQKDNPNLVTILETYASQDAYKSHIASPHFKTYKQRTARMVKSLKLIDQTALNPLNRINNFMLADPQTDPGPHPMSAQIPNNQ